MKPRFHRTLGVTYNMKSILELMAHQWGKFCRVKVIICLQAGAILFALCFQPDTGNKFMCVNQAVSKEPSALVATFSGNYSTIAPARRKTGNHYGHTSEITLTIPQPLMYNFINSSISSRFTWTDSRDDEASLADAIRRSA